jgi:hypothetical protein
MTKLTTFSIALAALAATAPAAPVPDMVKEPVQFFPTTPVTWVYDFVGVQGHVRNEVTEVVMSVRDVKGEKQLTLGSVHEGTARRSNLMMAVSGRGLVEGNGAVNFQFDPGDAVLRWPVVPGDTWVGRPRPAYKEWRYTTRGSERVEVPAGRYETVRVDTARVLYNGTTDLVTRAWYAPNVGMVKWEDSEGRLKVLKRFIRGMSGAFEPPLQPLPGVERR